MLVQHHLKLFAGACFVYSILRVGTASPLRPQPVHAPVRMVPVPIDGAARLRVLCGRRSGTVVDGERSCSYDAKLAHGNTVRMMDWANSMTADAPQGAAMMITTVTIRNLKPCEIVES